MKSRRGCLSNRTSGFSLTELLLTVAIIAVLSTVAIPSFQDMVSRARQSEAFSELHGILVVEKAFRSEYSNYTYCLEQAGFEPPAGANRYYLVGFKDDGPGAGTACFGGNAGPVLSCYQYTPGLFCLEPASPCGCTNAVCAFGNGRRNDCTFDSNSAVDPTILAGLGGWAASLPWIGKVYSDKFNALAIGSISSSPALDVWSIDQDNKLRWLNNGR